MRTRSGDWDSDEKTLILYQVLYEQAHDSKSVYLLSDIDLNKL